MRQKLSWNRGSPALVVAAALLPAAGGCSLALDWNPNRQQCDKGNVCSVGYSCLGTECVKDRSLADGETCNDNEQCQSGLICTPHPFLCRKPCDAYYVATGNCDRGTFCRPTPDLDTGDPVGSCVKSECNADGDCGPGKVCVKITDFAGTCLPSCSPSFPSGSYADGCQSSLSGPQLYCQPLPLAPDEPVCIDQSDPPQPNYNAQCDFGKATCARGSACIGGQCREYCDQTTGQPCGSARCSTASGGAYAVCSPP